MEVLGICPRWAILDMQLMYKRQHGIVHNEQIYSGERDCSASLPSGTGMGLRVLAPIQNVQPALLQGLCH